ncbi:MAG: DUF4349 domain-containing protein [Planctomycetota bacterium]
MLEKGRFVVLSLLLLAACTVAGRTVDAERVAVDKEVGDTGVPDFGAKAGLVAELDDASGSFNDEADGDHRGRTENLLGYVLAFDPGPAADLTRPQPGSGRPRLILRNGSLTLRTTDPKEVGRRAVAAVKEAGGWVTTQTNDQYTFRIPAARFEPVLEQIEALAVVVDRRIRAVDVTEKVRDLELRLKNARALRDRYQALLEKAKTVEEMLGIERELAKVTETVERLEGQLKKSLHDVAFSTLTLRLQTDTRRAPAQQRSPFQWITEIGAKRLPRFQAGRIRGSRVDWELPEGFADMGRVTNTSIRGWAYSPDGIRIVVRRFDHRPKLAPTFWQKEVRRELVEVRGYQEAPEPPGGGMMLFRAAEGDRPLQYGVVVLAGRRSITTVEVAGTREALEAHWTEVSQVIEQVRRRAR